MAGSIDLCRRRTSEERLGALESQSTKVIVRAVNRSYTSGKNAIAEEARKGYYLSQHDVNGKNILKITKATYSNPVATLKYTDRHRNLYLWNGKKAVSPGKIIHWSHGTPNVPIYKAAVKRGHGKVENARRKQTVHPESAKRRRR